MTVDVSAWRLWGSAVYIGATTPTHFRAINLLFVRFFNQWGPRGGILRTDREHVNNITGPLFLLHTEPVLKCWSIGREMGEIRQKKCACSVSYPVREMRSVLLLSRLFFFPSLPLSHARLDNKKQQCCRCRRCARC